MSFIQLNYQPIGGQSMSGEAPARYSYKTQDLRATVEAAGYFNAVLPALRSSDIVDVSFVTNISAVNEAVTEQQSYVVDSTVGDSISLTNVTISTATQADIDANTAAIAFLESQIGAPVPIEPAEPDVLQFAIADNTTIGSVAQWLNTTMTNWTYVVDSTATPIGDGTEGTINVGAYDLTDYDSHTLYGWYKDTNDTGIWTQVKPDPLLDDGEMVPGLEARATDTLGEVWADGAFTTSAGTDALTQIVLSINPLPVDTGSGHSRFDLHSATDDSLVLSNVIHGQEVSNLTPNISYAWYIIAYDLVGNTSLSNSYTTTTEGTSDAGTVNFDAVLFEQSESATVIGIGLTRSGGSTGEIAVKIETINRTTAGDGVAYYGKGLRTLGAGEITSSGTTATISSTSLAVAVGDYIEVLGADQSEYNGVFEIATVADKDTLTYTMSGTPAASPATGTITVHTAVAYFANGITAEFNSIKLIDQLSASSNDMFEVQIEHGSEDTGAVTCSIGALNSALCKILSSGSGVAGYAQEDTGDLKVVIETEAANATLVNAIETGNTADAWAVSGSNTRLSPEGGAGKQIQPNNAAEYGTATVIEAFGPYARYPINFTQTGDHTIHTRMKRQAATHERIHFALERELVSIGADGSGAGATQLITLAADHGMLVGDEVFFVGTAVAAYQYDATASTSFAIASLTANADEIEIADTGLGAIADASDSICFGEDRAIGMYSPPITSAPTQPVSGWRWTSTDSNDDPREIYIGTAGAYNLRLYEQDYQAQPDKVVIAPTSVAYDPNVGTVGDNSYDDKFGPVQSVYSGGDIIDNPENPTEPSEPLPSDTIAGTLSPADNETNVPATGLVVQAEFAGTELTYSIFEVTIGGTPITGVISTALPGIITFTASGSQPNNTLVTVTLAGTVRDSNFVLKSFSYSGTDWQFTTIDVNAASTLFSLDFEDYNATASPYVYTEADIIPDWNVGMHGYSDLNIVGPNKGNTHIVDDPEPAGTHGKVFRVRAEGGGVTVGQAVSIACDFGTSTPYAGDGPQDVYFSYDLFVATDHDFTFTQKNCALFTGTRTEATHGATAPIPEGDISFITFQSTYDFTSWPGITEEGEFSIFYYDSVRVQRDDWWDTVDPTDTDKTTNGYAQPRGRWITIEMRVGMNTVAVEGVTGNKDGPLQVWVTDPARWAGAKLVLDRLHAWQWTTGAMSVDRFWMDLYYGGDESAPINKPDHTQFHYYDNFLVSTNPITHT